jgi:hypothetical protein
VRGARQVFRGLTIRSVLLIVSVGTSTLSGYLLFVRRVNGPALILDVVFIASVLAVIGLTLSLIIPRAHRSFTEAFLGGHSHESGTHGERRGRYRSENERSKPSYESG